MNIINKKAKSVYLNASIKTIYGKLSKIKNKKKRPLIAEISNENLQEFIAKHLFERRPYYEQATCIINIDNKTKKEIATEISLDMQ